MDGNRRWAKNQGKSKKAGYEKGFEVAKEITKFVLEKKIPYLTLFALSTENWNRDKSEVNLLTSILSHYLSSQVSSLEKYNIKLNTIGNLENLAKKL